MFNYLAVTLSSANEALSDVLNQYAAVGWRVHTILKGSLAPNFVQVIFERRIDALDPAVPARSAATPPPGAFGS